ncbi:hypothetical protein I7I51_06804 [Histoplasma capsulatum]|uniref:Secreted protein n=1 Tax=Ajellomyces capsulatus TaxID=5037 RepID=A0A8A1MMU2_AJECA|nr:hypothetical protein I7I51_06804 [Histoplasma capsulatum]
MTHRWSLLQLSHIHMATATATRSATQERKKDSIHANGQTCTNMSVKRGKRNLALRAIGLRRKERLS